MLLQAGFRPGMRIADFGCGVGATTRMLAQMAGASRSVTGIDINGEQLVQAAELCHRSGMVNKYFMERSACETGLPRKSFDFVTAAFCSLHLQDPAACLREMRDVLKPGGILVLDDGDLASATSVPSSAMDAFADFFRRLGPTRGVNYSMARTGSS